jgi:group I intron endonuclease
MTAFNPVIPSLIAPDQSAFDKPVLRKSTRIQKKTKQDAPLPSNSSPKTAKLQKIIDENSTPQKTYPLTSKGGKVKIMLTPNVKKLERVIYMFRNKINGKVLIGKTESTIAKRTSAYVSSFNNPNTQKGKLALPKDVRKNPNNFEFGCLCNAPDDVDLDALETRYIDMKKELQSCYNVRRGGGGGHARNKRTKATVAKTKKVLAEIQNTFTSPEKKPVVKTKKGPTVLLTPKTKKSANVIYVFKNNVTEQRYVGKTIRELRKRVSEHMHYARHTDKEESKKELYKDLRKNPANFSVGILYKAPKDSKDIDLDEIEKSFISHYDSVKTGYNKNSGGGGG